MFKLKQALVFTWLLYKSFENIEGKGGIGCKEQFLLYSQCFQPDWRTFRHFHQIGNCRLQTLLIWKSPKFVVWEGVNMGMLVFQDRVRKKFSVEEGDHVSLVNVYRAFLKVCVDSLPNYQFLEWTKFKALADDKLKFANDDFLSLGKRENTGFRVCLLSLQCYNSPLFQGC